MNSRQVPRYELEEPTAALLLTSLSRYVDEDEAIELFAAASRAAGTPQEERLSPDELLKVVAQLEQMGDLAATCAKGLRVRIMSYIVLAAAQLNH